MKVLPLILCVGFGCSVEARVPDDVEEETPLPPAWGVPLTGGTMLVTRDGTRAVVADPDRDRVFIVDLAGERVADTISLASGSEPGRVIEDDAGRLHVALRGSGELLTITGTDRLLRAVCGEPRGVAAQAELVHVACATGELVSLPCGGGDPVRVVRVERDLRDVIVRATGALAVTTFRSAELLDLDAQGAIVKRTSPPIVQRVEREKVPEGIDAVGDIHNAVAAVAWRTIALPDGRIVMSHQRRLQAVLETSSGGYGGRCSRVVESALTVFSTDGAASAVAPATDGALPLDIAFDAASGSLAVVTAGNEMVWTIPSSALAIADHDDCESAVVGTGSGHGNPATAVAFKPDGSTIAFLSEEAKLTFRQAGTWHDIDLDESGYDPGRAMFHRETIAGIACASCHPEARDDGGVWTFDTLGVRRTQTLGGSILSRAPYHWGADMPTLPALLDDVFGMRMSGGGVGEETAQRLGAWIDHIPAPRGVVSDAGAVARGAALFDAPELGCRSCHTGTLFTNNKLANVGLGNVKVPSLVGVGGRAPYMHDGCAATLRDRFGACGGGDNHGHTSQLSAAELDDLVAYLESL